MVLGWYDFTHPDSDCMEGNQRDRSEEPLKWRVYFSSFFRSISSQIKITKIGIQNTCKLILVHDKNSPKNSVEDGVFSPGLRWKIGFLRFRHRDATASGSAPAAHCCELPPCAEAHWKQIWNGSPSGIFSHIPPNGKAGKSSTQKCRLVRGYVSSVVALSLSCGSLNCQNLESLRKCWSPLLFCFFLRTTLLDVGTGTGSDSCFLFCLGFIFPRVKNLRFSSIQSPGALLPFFRESGCDLSKVTGVDLSAGMLSFARERFAMVERNGKW